MDIEEIKNEIQQIRNVSFPYMYVVIEEIRGDIKKILEAFSNIHTKQAIIEIEIEPLKELPLKQVETETKLKTISGILWGIGSLIGAGIIGLGGWLFSLIVGKTS